MTAEKLIDCIGMIDEKYISEAEDYSPAVISKDRILVYVSAAACLCVIIAAAAFMADRMDDISDMPDMSMTEVCSATEITCSTESITTEISAEETDVYTEETVTTAPIVTEEIIFPAFTGVYEEPEEMPEPFYIPPEGGGDENYMFNAEVNFKLDGIDMSFINYVGADKFEEWIYSYRSEYYTAVDEFANLYSFIKYFDFPLDKAEETLRSMQEVHAHFEVPDCISDEDIALILRGTPEEVAEHFATPYTICKGKSLYSPEWLYYHTIEEYRAAGITEEDVLSRIKLYSEVWYTDEGRKAFSEKLSAFTGKEIWLTAPEIPENTYNIPRVIDDIPEEPIYDDDIEEPVDEIE